MNDAVQETVILADASEGLGELRFRHPPGAFALTPASRQALQTIGRHARLLAGQGLDWGCGCGCLAIAAARLPAVTRVIGLDIAAANVAIARENAGRNGVGHKCAFWQADSYTPYAADARQAVTAVAGQLDFILANPPASDGDDGFAFRRMVLRGARDVLRPGGVVFLSISSQYGQARLNGLTQTMPQFRYGGLLSSSGWTPFDLQRPDLRHCLELYAAEEQRGGALYTFQSAETAVPAPLTAQQALALFQRTGRSPLSQWQTHLFRYQG